MTIATLPETAQLYKTLGHPARLRVLAMLRSGELCACQITTVLSLAPSTISAHLAELRRAGLITQRKSGRWVHFKLCGERRARRILKLVGQQLEAEPQVRRDETTVRRLRLVPVEELCRPEPDPTK